MIQFNLNGKLLQTEKEPYFPLSDILLFEGGCYSLKRGCNNNSCGTCVVLFNNQPYLSCSLPLYKVHKGEVTTLEGVVNTPLYKNIIEGYTALNRSFCDTCFSSRTLLLWYFLDSARKRVVLQRDDWFSSIDCPSGCTSFDALLPLIRYVKTRSNTL